jgi:hypothetical protein
MSTSRPYRLPSWRARRPEVGGKRLRRICWSWEKPKGEVESVANNYSFKSRITTDFNGSA